MEDYSNFTDDQIEEVVESMRESELELKEYMDNYYKELLFIGNASTLNETLLNAAIFGLKVCLCYYMQEEDYKKVAEVKKLLDHCINPKKSIVDSSIIESIELCFN